MGREGVREGAESAAARGAGKVAAGHEGWEVLGSRLAGAHVCILPQSQAALCVYEYAAAGPQAHRGVSRTQR